MASVPTTPEAGARHTKVIEPVGRLELPDLRELWGRRDLIYMLVRRDVGVRYKQSAIGVLWVVLQPTLLAIVFSVFLGRIAKIASGTTVPYPVFAVAGMVCWLFFANALGQVSASTVTNSALISKVYFPRIIIPISAVLAPAFDFLVSLSVVFAALAIYGVPVSPRIVLVLLVLPLILMVALGLGLWLSALHVKYRDVQILTPFLIQIGFFVTPIIYPASLAPDSIRPIFELNPMVGALEYARWCLFESQPWPGMLVLTPVVAGVLLVVSGALYFQRVERRFADLI